MLERAVIFILAMLSTWAMLYSAIAWRRAWNDRPLVMWDHRTKHWRAASLIGRPYGTRRHGHLRVVPLERRQQYTVRRLERPAVLEQPLSPTAAQPPTAAQLDDTVPLPPEVLDTTA